MKILVTDGDNRATLAITRSLGKKGNKIIIGERQQPSLASSSKYCYDHFAYPDPAVYMNEFIETLIQVVREKEVDVIFPVSDISTILVSENKNAFEQYCEVPFSNSDKITSVANKAYVANIAKKLGIPVPRTIYISRPEQVYSLPEDMPFPVVVKSYRSRVKTDHGWISTVVTYANNKEELTYIVKSKNSVEYPLLIQERIYGPGIGVFSCYNLGKLVAMFSHRRLREKPPSGGVSVLRESIPVSPLGREYSEKLFNHLNWHGVAMAEFKLDRRDNIPKLMEINGRFWGSLQLAIDAGVDFPSILLDTIEKEEITTVFSYQNGVKTRWLWGDIDALLMMLFKNGEKLKLPSYFNGKMMYFLKFLKIWEKNLHYEVLSLTDLKPWIYETIQWCKRRNSKKK